ncbi:hypothetical protein [Chromobacterium haemolyticum]|uniref:hypothetical protein n=1 Tax=Chromobacterium haemolyticum TaxID=394935 RepID=UPI001C37FFAB|nr:hypothetical protein [Chromobacterium haemolyticum]
MAVMANLSMILIGIMIMGKDVLMLITGIVIKEIKDGLSHQSHEVESREGFCDAEY